MLYFRSFLAILACLTSLTIAQSGISFSQWPSDLQTGKPVTFKWNGNPNAPVTITLAKGPANGLKDVKVITAQAQGGSFTWTPDGSVPKGSDYAFKISQDGQVNYSDHIAVNEGSTQSATSNGPLATESSTSTGTMSSSDSTTQTGTTTSAGTTSQATATTTGTTTEGKTQSSGTTTTSSSSSTTSTATTSKALPASTSVSMQTKTTSFAPTQMTTETATATSDANASSKPNGGENSNSVLQTNSASVFEFSFALTLGTLGFVVYNI